MKTPEEQLEAARAHHQPLRDPAWSLVSWAYCSCGAYESFLAGDGEMSLGPAKYPCKTARALGVSE